MAPRKRSRGNDDMPIALRHPKRACRRHVNYQASDERDDPGCVFEFDPSNYIVRRMDGPCAYDLRLGGELEEGIDEDEMRRRFNPELIEFVNVRRGGKVYMSDVYRLWLMPDEEDMPMEEMKLDYLCLPPDEVEDGSQFANAPGIYHAGEMFNDVIKWFPIQLHTLSMMNLIAVLESELSPQLKDLALAFKVVSNDTGRAAYSMALSNPMHCVDILDKYCLQCRGERVRVSGPGNRKPSVGIGPLRVCSLRQFMGGMPDMCLHAAFLNCVWLATDWKYAEKALKAKHSPIAYNLKRLSRYAQIYSSHVTLRTVETLPGFDQMSPEQISVLLNGTAWLDVQKTGVFIAQLLGSDDVNHMVCIDFGRRWIVDSIEHTPIDLSLAGLDFCCGRGSHFVRFGEVRLVEPCGDWNRQKKCRGRSHSKRKRAAAN